MAGRQRNDVDYFPHTVRHGKKMSYIEKKYGNDGYAVWFKLLEECGAAHNHYLDLSDDIQIMFLSDRCMVSEDTLLSIIEDLIKLKEFDVNFWTEHKVLFNEKFIESISDAYKKRKNKCVDKISLGILLDPLGKNIPPLRNPNSPLSHPNTPIAELKGDGGTQTIVKETIVNNSKVNNSKNYILIDLEKIEDLEKYFMENLNLFFEQLCMKNSDKDVPKLCATFVEEKTQSIFTDVNHLRNAFKKFIEYYGPEKNKDTGVPSFHDSGCESIDEYKRKFQIKQH